VLAERHVRTTLLGAADGKSRSDVKPGAVHQTRPGDWAMRMRFWGENTREIEAAVCKRLSTRAFHPKARSHHPITVPSAFEV